MSSISIHHDYSLLSTCANFHPAFFTLLHNFIVKMGFIVLLSLVLAGELPGFRKENDDNGVTDHKHKARTDEGDGQIPEVLAGDLDGKRQLKGKFGDQDQNKAYLDHPEQIGDLPKLAVPQDGGCALATPGSLCASLFLCFCFFIRSKMAPKKEKAPPPSSKPAKSGGGKQKKKKWSKGKQKEKVNNMVLFDQAAYDKLLSEAPKYKLITPSILSDRLRINGSLARRAIKELMARGLIRMVSSHSSQQIYTRATNAPP
ncbi:unnamed protein product, partial [Vitis vinifera]